MLPLSSQVTNFRHYFWQLSPQHSNSLDACAWLCGYEQWIWSWDTWPIWLYIVLHVLFWSWLALWCIYKQLWTFLLVTTPWSSKSSIDPLLYLGFSAYYFRPCINVIMRNYWLVFLKSYTLVPPARDQTSLGRRVWTVPKWQFSASFCIQQSCLEGVHTHQLQILWEKYDY